MQRIIDALADDIERSVAVDNTRFELLAASAQYGSIDEYRVAAIINREPPQEPLQWMRDHGVETAHRYVRIAPHEEMNFLGRLCFPLRQDSLLLGFLWLIDDPEIGDAITHRVEVAVHELVSLLSETHEDLQTLVLRNREVYAQILDPDSGSAGLEAATTAGILPENGRLTIAVQRLVTSPGADPLNVAMKVDEIERELVGYSFSSAFVFGLERDLLWTITRRPTSQKINVSIRELNNVLNRRGIRVGGVGYATVPDLTALFESSKRAEFSLRIAALLESTEPCAWGDLGSWKLFFGLPLTRETVYELSTGAQKLLEHQNSELWVSVLEYLESGRRIKEACERLIVHRTTLHYRLNRAQEVMGQSLLDEGWESLSLHAALRLHQALEQST